MLSRFFLIICRSICYLLVAGIVLFNLSLHHTPAYLGMECISPNEDLLAQDRFLREAVNSGADREMQRLFPEGKLFMQTLAGLVNRSAAYSIDEEFLTRLQRDTSSRKIFPRALPLPYGAFYRGWRHLAYRHDKYLYREIRVALAQSESPYLESYHDGAWPADMVVLMAALQPSYSLEYTAAERDTIHRLTQNWLNRIRNHLDPVTGMLPHLVDARSGATIQGARGSSSSLILSLLPDIDSSFAEEQFQLYEKYFVASRLGLPAIREYPVGATGRGDIDSGPVIWGIGGAASIVGQRAAGINGRTELFLGLRAAIQSFGLAFTWRGKRRYLFGQLPIVDAWTAWSNSVAASEGAVRGHYWPWWFHLLSLGVIGILVWLVRRF